MMRKLRYVVLFDTSNEINVWPHGLSRILPSNSVIARHPRVFVENRVFKGKINSDNYNGKGKRYKLNNITSMYSAVVRCLMHTRSNE